jgi:hypothetical protein
MILFYIWTGYNYGKLTLNENKTKYLIIVGFNEEQSLNVRGKAQ